MAHDVFISYSSKDKKIADAVCSKLENGKVKCWIAPRDIVPSQTFAGAITKAIKSSTIFLLIFSSNSNNSDAVLNEVELAKRNSKVILPFKTDEFEMNPDLEYYLASVHWMEVIAGDTEESIEKLVEQIKKIVPIFVESGLETVAKDTLEIVAKKEEKPKEPCKPQTPPKSKTFAEPILKTVDTKSGLSNAKTQATFDLAKAKPGDIVMFGKYEQDINPANGKENIEWRVLAVENGKALLLSEKILDCKPYNEVSKDVNWEICTLRAWLNNDFYNAAFSAEEQNKIVITKVINEDNPSFGTAGGNDINDKVFLLSIEEAKKYFLNDSARLAQGTKVAKKNGSNPDNLGNSPWWLRTPGYYSYFACSVYYDGNDFYHSSVYGTYFGVRPALWLSL